MPFSEEAKPYLRNCQVLADDAKLENKILSIYPNGRAETLIQDENGEEYYLVGVYRSLKSIRDNNNNA